MVHASRTLTFPKLFDSFIPERLGIPVRYNTKRVWCLFHFPLPSRGSFRLAKILCQEVSGSFSFLEEPAWTFWLYPTSPKLAEQCWEWSFWKSSRKHPTKKSVKNKSLNCFFSPPKSAPSEAFFFGLHRCGGGAESRPIRMDYHRLAMEQQPSTSSLVAWIQWAI